MIRKAIIVVLALGATLFCTLGLLTGAARTSWNWSGQDFTVKPAPGDTLTFIGWGAYRRLTVVHAEYLSEPAMEMKERFSLPGGHYQRAVTFSEELGMYSKSRTLIVYWTLPLVFGALLGVYPAAAFYRGPLRYWRRRRKGLCLGCGYDLTGNESGVCPECGVQDAA